MPDVGQYSIRKYGLQKSALCHLSIVVHDEVKCHVAAEE